MHEDIVIHAEGLIKSFGDFEVVKGVDFSLKKGSCVGLLGPNGAGKSTIMRMIMGVSSITAGQLNIFNIPVFEMDRKNKARIGLVPQENNFDPDITIRQNLEVYGRYFGLLKSDIDKRIPKLLDFMGLQDKLKLPVNVLSGGLKRRLLIARSLINDPELIILDEPTTGLDPQVRILIWKQLLKLKSRGHTLLLTTHYMDEAQRLCDQIIIIDQGKILGQGSPRFLIKKYAGKYVVEVEKEPKLDLDHLNLKFEDYGDTAIFFTDKVSKVVGCLPDGVKFQCRPANLEDVFLRLTGRQLREA